MPVEFDDDSDERAAPDALASRSVTKRTSAANREAPPAFVQRSVAPIVAVSLRAIDAPTALSVNRAAANALAIEHRWELVQHRSKTPPAAPAPLSPEEKLLLAIFSERASGLNVAELDDDGLPRATPRWPTPEPWASRSRSSDDRSSSLGAEIPAKTRAERCETTSATSRSSGPARTTSAAAARFDA